ncbi:MAG: type II toxin-antitoxin system VapC family toxin [Conexibacteraceae bacterium]|nr:type II toxin-antitoxin system VapC family toxin [Conexibacteraceae bacterium]
MAAAAERGVLDTSTVIVSAGLDAQQLPTRMFISAVTLAELAVGPLVAGTTDERVARQGHLQLAAELDLLPFDDRCAREFAPIAAQIRAGGSKRRARAYDTLIAATAIANAMPLYTANPDDFEGIPGLDLRPVPAPED